MTSMEHRAREGLTHVSLSHAKGDAASQLFIIRHH